LSSNIIKYPPLLHISKIQGSTNVLLKIGTLVYPNRELAPIDIYLPEEYREAMKKFKKRLSKKDLGLNQNY